MDDDELLCAVCETPIVGPAYYDPEESWWVGTAHATPFHDKECAAAYCERQQMGVEA